MTNLEAAHKIISEALESEGIKDADLYGIKVRAIVKVPDGRHPSGRPTQTRFVNVYSTDDPLYRAGLDAPPENHDIWG